MKKYLNNSKGYSLVEMIIVLAVIVVLSAMALVSIRILNSAKAKDAAITLGEEINLLKQKCMNMSPDDMDSNNKPVGKYDSWALAIYLTSDDNIATCLVKHEKATNLYEYVTDEDIVFSKRVDVRFKGKNVVNNNSVDSFTTINYSNEKRPGEKTNYYVDDTVNYPIYISFDKRGKCISGAGDFYFYKKNSNQVARVQVKDNGSIVIK